MNRRKSIEKYEQRKNRVAVCSLISISCVLFVSIYPHGVAWNEGARTRTHAGVKRASVWQLRAPLCSTCSDRNYAKRRSPRERERGERMGSALETGEKKKKGKRKRGKKKRGGRETVGEMEKPWGKELDSELTNLCKKKKKSAATTRFRKFCNLSWPFRFEERKIRSRKIRRIFSKGEISRQSVAI